MTPHQNPCHLASTSWSRRKPARAVGTAASWLGVVGLRLTGTPSQGGGGGPSATTAEAGPGQGCRHGRDQCRTAQHGTQERRVPQPGPGPGQELRGDSDRLSLQRKLLRSRSALAQGQGQGHSGAHRVFAGLQGTCRPRGLRGHSRVLPLGLRNQRSISKKTPSPKATC